MEKFFNVNNFTDQKFLLDNFLFSVGPLTALIAARLGRNAWIKYEIAFSILLGLVLAFKPDLILPILLKSSMKHYHFYLCAALAAYIIGTIVAPFLLLNSQDESIFYGHYYAKIVEHTLVVIDNIIVYNEGIHWNYKYLCLSTSIALTHLFINAYFLARTPKPSGQNPFKDMANSVGKLDFYIMLIYGVFIYAFPDRVNFAISQSQSVFNESYRSLLRTCGAIALGTSIESFCMSEFKFIRDKKTFLLTRLVASFLELCVFFAGFYCFHIYTLDFFGQLALISITYKAIMFYGYANTPHEHIKSH